MNIAKKLLGQRQQLGLSDEHVARLVGLSIHEYGDVEQHADEFETAISVGSAKKICHVLGFGLRHLLGLPTQMPTDDRSLSELVSRQRENQGLSVEQLAERIGFSRETIEGIEANAAALDLLPLVVIYDLEDALGFERGSLVRA